LGSQRRDLAGGEFILAVTVPQPRAGLRLASYKVSKRIDQDISAVCAAFAPSCRPNCAIWKKKTLPILNVAFCNWNVWNISRFP